jgi:predicted nucleic acid-binding protein
VSEESGAVQQPYILDVSVLTAVARADAEVTRLILELDARGRPLVLPALAMAAAALDTRSEDADDALRGLERLDNAEVAPLRDAEQAARLAAVIARTDLDPWDAHVAAVADASVCPILTLDAAKWRQHAGDLDDPLHIIEVADPDESDDPGSSAGAPE